MNVIKILTKQPMFFLVIFWVGIFILEFLMSKSLPGKIAVSLCGISSVAVGVVLCYKIVKEEL